MAHHSVDQSLHPVPSEPGCLEAEFVPAVEAQIFADDGSDVSSKPYATETNESALATLEPTLQATDSFEFNYVDRPTSLPEDDPVPPNASDPLVRLFTPWSLGGLCLLVVANGLLTIHSFSRQITPPVAISGFGELPPVISIPATESITSNPSLAIDHLSELPLPQTPPSPALTTNPTPALPLPPPVVTPAPTTPTAAPPPPPVSLASRLLPPAINPQQAMVPAAPPQGYPTYATARANAPQPPQPPNTFPTIAVDPVYRPQLTTPLPPPPPPPLSQGAAPPASSSNHLPAPPSTAVPAPNPWANTTQAVELQIRQQLPTNPGSGNRSAVNSGTPSGQTPGTKPYNQSPGISPAGMSPTQQLVQELESLNQGP